MHKRMNKRAQLDPSMILLNSMSAQPLSASHTRASQAGIGINEDAQQRLRQIGQQQLLQKKILGGPRLAKSKSTNYASFFRNDRRKGAAQQYASDTDLLEDDKDNKSKASKQAEYYKFYLNNAQKAIDLMIEQHKSQSTFSQ